MFIKTVGAHHTLGARNKRSSPTLYARASSSFGTLINWSLEKGSLATAHGEVVGESYAETSRVSPLCSAWIQQAVRCVGHAP